MLAMGSLVQARGLEWIGLPESTDDLLALRLLDSTDREAVGIYLLLEGVDVQPAGFDLTRDELCYILDPKDVYGPDFPDEMCRVLKEKGKRAYGEYRTRRLVLEAWDWVEEV